MLHKRFFWILAVLIIVIGGAVLAVYYSDRRSNRMANENPGSNSRNNESEFVKSDVESYKLPNGFPIDMPLEENARILQNYVVSTPDGRSQSTRSFETQKSLAENYKLYSDYMKKNNWEINVKVDQANLKVLSGSSAGLELKIDITQSSVSSPRVVTISLISSK